MDSSMTATLRSETPRSRERLADPACGRAVAAMVRRRFRGSGSDADDLTQTVLCDALAAPQLPSEPGELRRFLAILTRNKVIDHFRRLRRFPTEPDAVDALGCEAPPVEDRELLARVAAAASPRDRETLGWLVREHEGEQLAEIALGAGLPAPTVRQRVARLRRALRAEWAPWLLLLLVLGSTGLALEQVLADRRPSSETITFDPDGDAMTAGDDPRALALALAQGSWRVVELSPVDPVAASVRVLGIEVVGRTVKILAPVRVGARIIHAATRVPGGAGPGADRYDLELRDARGGIQHASVSLEEGGLVVTLHDGPFRGKARLAR